MTTPIETIEAPPPIISEPASDNPVRESAAGKSWWVVSVLFHGLVILLGALVTVEVTLPTNDDSMVIMTEFAKPPELIDQRRQGCHLPNYGQVAWSENSVNLSEPLDAVVTEEMLCLAKQGNTAEKIDLDRSNSAHSATTCGDAILDEVNRHENASGGGGLGEQSGLAENDDLIGMGSSGAFGSGGGFGGGNGTGVGWANGAAFSSRTWNGRPIGLLRYVKFGGTHESYDAWSAGLRWLANHQESDGHWDTLKLGASQKTDSATTGLALLAFLAAGHTERLGEFKMNVTGAVNWLKSHQQANGLICDATDAGAHRGIGYPHAIATLALAEAAGMSRLSAARTAAQKAIDYCVEQQQCGEGSEKLGWRYGPKQAGDLSVTGWYVMALKSAKVAGLHVNYEAFEGALKFLKSVEIPNDVSVGEEYGTSVRYGYQPGDEHARSTHRLTAIGSVIRIYMGEHREEVQPTVEWFIAKGGVPTWGANGSGVDMYYWYYGSLSAFQVGGDVWKTWGRAMISTLTENQCKRGDDTGSWPIVGEYSSEWGRAGQTAMSCLMLSSFVRYPVGYMKLEK